MSAISDILTGLKVTIDNLGISNLSVVIRKRAVVGDRDTLPIIVLCPDTPKIDSEHTENTIVWMRPVWVVLCTPTGDELLESRLTELPTLEERIRKALHTTTLIGTTVFDSDIESENTFVSNNDGYDLTAFRIKYLSEESRT